MTHRTHTALRQLRSLLNFNLLPEPWRKFVDLIRGERLQAYFIAAFTLWLVGAVEIIQKTGGQGLDPRFWMLIAVLITFYSGNRIFRLSTPRRKFASGKQSGAVTGMMNRIRANGLAVYSPAAQDNSGEYVAVGPAGVYAIEVKIRNVFGSRTIEYRREDELVLGGRIADSRALKQAKAAAQNIREKLHGILPARSAVKPLVVFLNDWQINRPATERDVAVVNADELEQYLNRQEPILSAAEIADVSTCLNEHAFAAA